MAMTHFTRVAVFLAIVASLLFYLVAARRVQRQAQKSADDFYLAKQSITPSTFAAAQTAYQLQMATIYPFFTFAFVGMWWVPMLNILFYGLGICLYIVFIPKFHRARSMVLGSSATIHAAIAGFHRTPRLRLITALITMIGFTGLAAFEIIWGATVFKALFNGGNVGGDVLYYVAICILTLYLVTYISVGGQKANFRTSPFQLLFAYVGLHALVAWVANIAAFDPSKPQFVLTVVAIAAMGAWMMWHRIRGRTPRSESKSMFSIDVVTVVSLACMLLALLWFSVADTLGLRHSNPAVQGATDLTNFWWAAASVSLLPLFFQFVDMSNWQRLTAIDAEEATLVQEARRGLRRYLIESPLSWLLPVYLGLGAAQFLSANPDPWANLLTAVLAVPAPLAPLFPIVVFVGLIAVFMSTAEELLTAIGYAYSRDISPRGKRIIDRAHRAGKKLSAEEELVIINRGRAAAWISISIVTISFVVADVFMRGGGTLIGLFMSFYTPIIALAPCVFVPAVTGRAAHKSVAYLSVSTGVIGGLAAGFWSAWQPSALGGAIIWTAPVISFGLSWGIYLLGYGATAFTSRQPVPIDVNLD